MPRALALLGLLVVLVGCRQTGGVSPADADPATDGPPSTPAFAVVVDQEGPWRTMAGEDPEAGVSVTRHRLPGQAPPAPATSRPPGKPGLAVPRRRVTAPPAPAGTKPTLSPEQRARERYIAHPTLIRASRITFYCPAAYLAEVRLNGADLSEPAPGRRVAIGSARLTCRELTLEADRITLRPQPAGTLDLQLTAKGGVAYVTDQRGQVFRGAGLNILLVTNEQITPLR